ncbi:MAG: hypothetical protein D6788_09950, partial [Planctomycetota bacterium]
MIARFSSRTGRSARSPRRVSTTALKATCALAVLVLAPGAPLAAQETATASRSAASTSRAARLVHRFDFNERPLGNLEDLPKYWEPLRPAGFPHYTRGGFDEAVGHEAPPSFHLASEGRNVAFQYNGPETRVRLNTEYRVVGYIRPQSLRHARACLSAHFVDRAGRPIVETLTRSPFVGGSGSDEWTRVVIDLPQAPPEAYTIAVTAWVLQRDMWDPGGWRPWEIPRRDVSAGAWFDDIALYALPRVALSCAARGNVIPPDGPFDLEIVFSDSEDPGLRGLLTIVDATGNVVETHPVPVTMRAAGTPRTVSTAHLPPGLYRARLDIVAGDETVVTRAITFARLAPLVHPGAHPVRRLGVVLQSDAYDHSETVLALLRHQRVQAAKVPLWGDRPLCQPGERACAVRDAFFQALVKAGFALTGVFEGIPGDTATPREERLRALVEWLGGDPAAWRDRLAMTVAPWASLFQTWQLGADRQPPHLKEEGLILALERMRKVMADYISVPRLAVVQDITRERGLDGRNVAELVLAAGPDASPAFLGERIRTLQTSQTARVSTYIPPLPEASYTRTGRLAHWAVRVLEARHAGADVYVPQPWRIGTRNDVQPDETYLLLRTIADLIGDAKPGPVVPGWDGVRALAFYRGDEAVVALWDPQAPLEGRLHTLQLGRADRQYDLWGRATTLPEEET